MEPRDTIDMILLVVGLVWGVILLYLWRRNKSKPKMWPRLLGIGGWVYGFTSLMTTSILLSPKSEIVNYTISNFLWSLAVGVVCYFSGRILADRFGKQ